MNRTRERGQELVVVCKEENRNNTLVKVTVFSCCIESYCRVVTLNSIFSRFSYTFEVIPLLRCRFSSFSASIVLTLSDKARYPWRDKGSPSWDECLVAGSILEIFLRYFCKENSRFVFLLVNCSSFSELPVATISVLCKRKMLRVASTALFRSVID